LALENRKKKVSAAGQQQPSVVISRAIIERNKPHFIGLKLLIK
jgi:hypothetical protein